MTHRQQAGTRRDDAQGSSPLKSNYQYSKLGSLESQLLRKLWSRENATVRELMVDGQIQLAYTTVMTTLDRMYQKGLLKRRREGRAFRYSAACAPADLPQVLAAGAIQQCIESLQPAGTLLSYFVDAVATQDVKLLDDLQLLVEQRREELRDPERRR